MVAAPYCLAIVPCVADRNGDDVPVIAAVVTAKAKRPVGAPPVADIQRQLVHIFGVDGLDPVLARCVAAGRPDRWKGAAGKIDQPIGIGGQTIEASRPRVRESACDFPRAHLGPA